MKRNYLVIVLVVNTLRGGHSPLWAELSYQNFDFEQARVPIVTENIFGEDQKVMDALPGWRAYLGGQLQEKVMHNNITLGSAGIALFGPVSFSASVLEGSFSVVLQAGADPFDLSRGLPATIAQTITIPTAAKSIFFATTESIPFVEMHDRLNVSFDGMPASLFLAERGAGISSYAVDLRDYSGRSGNLLFTALPQTSRTLNSVVLDALEFSPQVVPEPGTATMFFGGLVLLGWKAFRGIRE